MQSETYSETKHVVFLSVGSNMGDKVDFCRKAMQTIESSRIGAIVGCSDFYRTEPVDYTDQDWFVNAALKIETTLSPPALLSALQQVQSTAGRKKSAIRFGPRPLDLDIIFYDNIVFEDEQLVIPHPRMHKRRFVLQPICDIDPQIVHPVLGKTVWELLHDLADNEQRMYRCVF